MIVVVRSANERSLTIRLRSKRRLTFGAGEEAHSLSANERFVFPFRRGASDDNKFTAALCQNIFDYVTVHIGQTEVTTLISIRQFFVIDTH